MILLAVVLLGGCRRDKPQVAVALPDSLALDGLRSVIRDRTDLFDPFSVEFRELAHSAKDSTTDHWCGEINTKNRQGGYIGWRAFTLTRTDTSVSLTVENSDDIDPETAALLLASCRPLGLRGSRFSYLAVLDSMRRENERTYAEYVARVEEEERQLEIREAARRDSIIRVLGRPSDRLGEINVCVALVGKGADSRIQSCLMRHFRWGADRAAMYWQYQVQGRP